MATQTFQWTGINAQGKRISGTLQAVDMKEAHFELKRQNVEVITLQPKKGFQIGKNKSFGSKKIKPKEILLFTRYLSTMLTAGLPIIQALDIIAHDQENIAMQQLVVSLKNSIAEGKTLAESFSQYPKYFGDLYCNLIKAGEKSGTLNKILARLAVYLERTENLKRKIKKAMIYPVAIISVATIVSLILLIFVVPQFQKMFESFGAELPFFTRMVVNLSNFLRSYWWVFIGAIAVGVVAIKQSLRKSDHMQILRDRYILKVYVVGGILKNGMIARFTRTLATTLEAGMPIVESMKALSQIMGNKIYTKAVLQICDDVMSGHQLSESMSSTKLFPNMALQMISVGEASGRLSDMLNTVADYYEEEVNVVVDNLSTLLEPLIMVILGGVVGSFVIAMYLPIFKIGSLF